MQLVKGQTYDAPNTDLRIKVVGLYHVTDEYYKAKIQISNRYSGGVYEIKTYKLNKNSISHWEKVSICPYCKTPCGNSWCEYCSLEK